MVYKLCACVGEGHGGRLASMHVSLMVKCGIFYCISPGPVLSSREHHL